MKSGESLSELEPNLSQTIQELYLYQIHIYQIVKFLLLFFVSRIWEKSI